MRLLEALTDYLRNSVAEEGLGRLYSASALTNAAAERGLSVTSEEVASAVCAGRGICLAFRGGHGTTQVRLEKPNREATLRPIDDGCYSLDTEAAVQSGVQQWFHRKGYLAKREVSDRKDVIDEIMEGRSLAHLPDEPTSRSTWCRDLMAHAPDAPTPTFCIIEVKGLTQVVSDFYDTFGQVFPIDDPAVTRGWTIRNVPKHGLCLKYARKFLSAWCGDGPNVLITLVVVVPDFPPLRYGPQSFYDGETCYYPEQVRMYARFLKHRDIHDDHTFARLLRHLRDRYRLLDMVSATQGIAFRFWGYQGLNWVRDFATNQPVQLPSEEGDA